MDRTATDDFSLNARSQHHARPSLPEEIPMTATPASFITGVDFVTVPARDHDESVHFYGTVLGLPVVKRWGDMPATEFQAGNLTLAVMDPTAFGQEFRPHTLPIALQVEDVPAARARLEAEGVQFVSDLIDSGFCHQAIFLDPAGNALDLHHRYAPNPA
jgi:predicted enzyme related to lactoylglutathione lyase